MDGQTDVWMEGRKGKGWLFYMVECCVAIKKSKVGVNSKYF